MEGAPKQYEPQETPDSAKVERLPERELESLDSFISKIEAGNYDDIIFLDKSGRTFWRALHERCKATGDGSLPQAHFVDIGTEKRIGEDINNTIRKGGTKKGGTVQMEQFRNQGWEDNRPGFHLPNPEMPLELFFSGYETPEAFYVSLSKKIFGTQKEKFRITNKEDARRMLQTLMESDARKIRAIFKDQFDEKRILIIDEEIETAESIKYAQVLFRTAYPTAHVDIGAYKSASSLNDYKKVYEEKKEELELKMDEKVKNVEFGEWLSLDEFGFLRGRFATEGFSIAPTDASVYWMGKPTHVEERYKNKDGKFYTDRSFTVQGITGELSLSRKIALADKDGKWAYSEYYSPENVKKRGLKGYSDQIKKIRARVSPEKEKEVSPEEPNPLGELQEEKGDA